MQDRDMEVEAEVQWRRVEAMNNAGLRGGESHEGGAPNLVQRGLFQRNRPLPQLWGGPKPAGQPQAPGHAVLAR